MKHHDINDKVLKSLLAARRLFYKGKKEKQCEMCEKGWMIIDEAIKEQYLLISKESHGEVD